MQVHRDLTQLPEFRLPVLTIGSFDGVHLGHQALLARIKREAQRVGGESVLVTFDPHPRHVLQRTNQTPLKLLTTTAEKCARLAAQVIDHVVIVPFDLAFSQQTAASYLREFLFGRFRPHTVVIGYDHRFGTGRSGDIHALRVAAEEEGIAIDEIPAQDIDSIAVSSTRIRAAVSAGQLEDANALLGYPYPLTGRVVHGQAIGRTIGFPTANLDVDNLHKLLPADGVYAVRASWAGQSSPLPAMLYIGERPSLAGKRPRTVEVNLLDFSGDLYNEMLHVEVVAHIRGDQAFASLSELRQQIERDRASTLEIFALT